MRAGPKRPTLRYHGGKWRLAPWIISHFVQHKVYVEPFGGGASVLIRKPRSYAEVYNDIEGEIVNLFRVLRSDPERLIETVRLTPFARDEFELSYKPTEDPIEQARRTLVRCGMGFGSSALSHVKTGFRGSATRSGTTPAHDWANQPANLILIAERLRGCVVENRSGMEVMAYHDSPSTLHYVDPPYVHSTRLWTNCKDAYRHEMTEDDHRELAQFLKTLKGAVYVSGYPSDLYTEIYDGWQLDTTEAMADKARKRTECLWMNTAASVSAGSLFAFQDPSKTPQV